MTFDPEVYTRLIERIKRVFTPDFLTRRQGWGGADRRPVFIVGLPRSGTTLTEQIVASHALVHGAGELSDVPRSRRVPAIVNQPSLDAFDAVSSLDPVTARATAQQYLDRLNKLAPGNAEHVVVRTPRIFSFLD